MWRSRYASVLRSECHMEPCHSLQSDCIMGSVVVTNPSSWQPAIAKHVAHALTSLQCVLCMFLCSSCVVSVAAPADRLDLLRAKDSWQGVELSQGNWFGVWGFVMLPYDKTGLPVHNIGACCTCFELQPLCLTITIIIIIITIIIKQ